MSNKKKHNRNGRYEQNVETTRAPKRQQPFYNINYIEESKKIHEKKNVVGNTVPYSPSSEEMEYPEYSQNSMGAEEIEYTEDSGYIGNSEDVEYESYESTEYQDYSEDAGYSYNDSAAYEDYSGGAGYEDYGGDIEYENYSANTKKSHQKNTNRSRKPKYVRNDDYGRTERPDVRHQRQKRHRKHNKQRKSLILPALLASAVLVVLVVVGRQVYADSKVYKVCRVEAGVSVSPSDFMKNGDEKAVFAMDSEPFNIAQPGKYHIKVKSGSMTYSSTLIIQDTIAPKAQATQAIVEVGKPCEAEKLVKNIEDATLVTVSYVAEPDFTKVGVQPVKVVLTDRGNNQTVVESELMVSMVAASVTVEAGGNPPDLASFVNGAANADFITPVRVYDYTKVGDHRVSISVDGQTYISILRIVDTVPPEATVQDLESFALLPIEAEEFVTEIEDVTEVKVTYGEEPDWTRIGTQEVEIILTDSGNNRTVKSAKLTLKQDTEPPSIQGAVDLKAFVGDSVSYRKNVSVTDNCPECELSVDTSSVDLNTAGVYSVVYTARDLAGNATSVTVNLTVAAREYSLDSVNALADQVLEKIIKPGMTDLEKVRAIYDYNMGHIGYINDSEKDDYVKAAYQGLSEGRGDCFVYASTAKVLLTRAGITNMDIEKIPAATLHYWNLVDIGEGWYHFDTTPRKDHPTIFMWTDEQLMDYSEKHNKSHNYDHSLYPEVN